MEYKPENQYCKSDDNKIYNNNISPINVEISSVKDLNNKKYIKRENFYIKIFIAIIYFALIILIEREYRNYLFDKSLKFQEDIRKIMIKIVLFMVFGNLCLILEKIK
jgi:hypothetical protein